MVDFYLVEVYRKCWQHLSSKEEAEAAIGVLVDLGRLLPTEHSPGFSGGAPSIRYELHSSIIEGSVM